MNNDLPILNGNNLNTLIPSTGTAGDAQWWTIGGYQPYGWGYPIVYPHVCPPPVVNTYITQTPRCAWCQGTHIGKCDNLKAVTYRKDGTVERVEFFEKD